MTLLIKNKIESLLNDYSEMAYQELTLLIYEFQAQYNEVYRRYIDLMGYGGQPYTALEDIPLMPISFFKHYEVKTDAWTSETIFKSSGTSDMHRSVHHVKELSWYNNISANIFYSFFDDDFDMLALLPSYLENGYSSLVQMVKHLTGDDDPHRFYLHNFDALFKQINHRLSVNRDKKVLLWGVTYALLDFVDNYKIDDNRLHVIFTGGMKRRGEELDFDTVIRKLKKGFPSSNITSEYGMTELFSQAYASENGIYTAAKTMKVYTKDFNDLTSPAKEFRAGQLGIIDIANYNTLSFIQTDDIAICHTDNKFELLGRMSNSDLRGCNMLYHF